MKAYVVKKKISIKAEPSVVWNALTNPEKTKQYFFNCEVFSDWEIGSTILFTGRMFLIKKIEMKGQILQIEPNKLLKYSLENSDDDGDESNFSTVTDKLTYRNGVTTLSITDDVGQGEGAEERYKRSEKGWDQILDGLKKLVESET
ncbi:SRPBCC domain-containing protein [Spirosoma sp. BT702]|uniref:SRPBCC domain-containing protein n=1 Tax=Spirosoma profusum TaxID=2771354 RepID=A0A926XWX2_9BACT|nr:SRPBCC domain-containing protein [Spirosoma profusum]MBD2701506.1 SRPBCC domain-containing protein [Spirosoma profusum]